MVEAREDQFAESQQLNGENNKEAENNNNDNNADG